MAVDKNKIVFMNTILKNPTLSRRISEAWEAPIGSTKRAQVKSMISSLKRTSGGKNDGQGGPGTSNPLTTNPYTQFMNQPVDPYSMVSSVDLKTPAPEVTFNTKPAFSAPAATTKPGAAKALLMKPDAVKATYQKVDDFLSNSLTQLHNSVPTGSPQDDPATKKALVPDQWLNTAEKKGMDDYLQYIKTQNNKNRMFGSVDVNLKKPSNFGMPLEYDVAVSGLEDPYNPMENEEAIYKVLTDKGVKKADEDKKVRDAFVKTPVISPSSLTNLNKPQGPSTKTGAAPASNSTDTTAKSYKTVDEAIQALKPGKVSLMINGQYAYMNMDGSIHVGKQGDNYIDPASKTQSPAATGTESATGATGTAGSATGATSTTGTTTGTEGTVPLVGGDKTIQDAVNAGVGSERFFNTVMSDKQKLIDLVGEDAAKEFGDSPFLSQQVADLTNVLKQNNNLDKLADQKKEMVARGGTLISDLTDYIDGRDTYLEDIDKSIDNIKKETLLAADPFSRKQGAKYLDFLYLMRGRQNQRYIDLLNTGITRYNQDLTNLNNEVTDATNKYTSELASETAITTEKYNYIKTYLTGLYDKVANAPQLAANAEYANIQLNNAKLDMIGKSLENEKKQKEILGGGSNDFYKNLAEVNKSGLITDADGNLQDGDISSYYKILIGNGTDVNVARAAIGSALKTKMQTLAADGDTAGLIKVKNQIAQMAKSGSTPEEKAFFRGMAEEDAIGILDNAVPVFKSKISADTKIKSALRDLTGEGFGGAIDPADSKAKAKWYDSYKTISRDILDQIWAVYQKNYNYEKGDPTRIFKPKDKQNSSINNLTQDDIAGLLSNQFREQWTGEVLTNQ